jgi:two-component system KDP operon response regulator KdpE
VLRALIVEDDETLRDALVGVLRLWGFDAVGAGSGSDALGLAANGGRPDVAILDLGLPDMTGEDVARQLRDGAPMTLVAISGQHERLRSLKAGLFDQTLSKPFPLLALRTCITSSIQEQARSDLLATLGAPRG